MVTKTMRWCLSLLCGLLCLNLAGCGSGKPKRVSVSPRVLASQMQPIRISHIRHQDGAQELMLRSLSLIGTPYRYGGSDRAGGFDCSGMVQYVYQDALNVRLPRSARDIAAVSQPIRQQDLRVGDLVFFNTNGRPYSHMGLYIGNGEFIHAPSSNGTIRVAKLSQPYFRQRFVDARTLFNR